ncbi:MAG: hypothetical protein OH316_01205, partial [Candidatus Parvarchaeota archaeon]|nr:hypothetical protein [Candidatus Parvarchaeota archaeon]
LNGIGQIIIYAIFMTGKVNRRLRDYYRLSTFIRSAGYLIAALSVFVIAGIVYLNMFSYLVAGIGYAFWNVSASVIMYVNIAGKSEAHYIGLWSAVIGFSGVVGSFLSGFISFYSGYMLTFAISIAFTLLSTAVFSHVYKDGEKIADFGNRI